VTTTTLRPSTKLSLLDDGQYRQESDKLDALRARVAGLEQRRSALLTGLVHADDSVAGRARALLDGHETTDRLRTDLAAVTDDLAVLRHAITLQESALERARRHVSREICDRLRPEHRAIVKRIAGALHSLSDALIAESAFRERLLAAGVEFTSDLRPMPFPPGRPMECRLDDPESLASVWFRDAREYHLLDDKEDPR
jgi:hypothetical protein